MPTSPFLTISAFDWLLSNELAIALLDRYPVNVGHSLVVTKRLISTWSFLVQSGDRESATVTVNDVILQFKVPSTTSEDVRKAGLMG